MGGDPTVLHFYRGWWCPKEQAFFRRLLALQQDAEVAYSRMVSVSVDPPEVSAAFRAGRCWLALVDGPAKGADAAARAVTADGHPAGTLAAWLRRAKPVREALRVDERLIDPDGSEAWISLVLPPSGVRLPFDDPAVQQARRLVLLHPFPAAVSTLLRDDSHFEGAITVTHSAAGQHRLRDDPFARIFPSRLLAVKAGILGSAPSPTGPTIERYGSGNPWPWDRFG